MVQPTQVLEYRKYKLIQAIMSLDSESALLKLEQEVAQIQENPTFWNAIKPVKKSTSLEEMIAEQNYVPLQKDAFYKKTSAINITEPLDELLLMFTP